ncbi:sugar-binding transcriptional regulator [Vallitalea okinawensis]|uniref:sugar-binding transcriptional regulator n=1 Tax=Vallitalea okinawensis TaxID=2078660 RepID=UPI000CFB2842|nr:sugar-binding domain-containing protein [Vallitalea okinawensis]
MLNKEEYQLIIDASVLYYLEGKTQSQIAKELYLSRPKVSRLLKKARDLQIVNITINYQNGEFEKLQSEVRRSFNVPHVVISKTLSNRENTLDEVCKAAAKELSMALRDDMTLGISWGKHVRTTAKHMKPKSFSNMRIVELFGAISYDIDVNDMLSIGRSLSSKLKGKLYPLPSPIYINDPIAREAIINTPVIKDTLSMIENCDLIVTGIGSIQDGESKLDNTLQTLWDNYVESNIKEKIVQQGGTGFLLAHFFDKNGNFLDMDINRNVVGIKTQTIKEKKIIAIASGRKKAKAIYSVLKGGFIHTLVSDEETLKDVMELYNEERK